MITFGAISHYKAALRLSEATGDVGSEFYAEVHVNLAGRFVGQADFTSALDHLHTARVIYDALSAAGHSVALQLGSCYYHIAQAYDGQGRTTEAITAYECSIAFHLSCGESEPMVTTMTKTWRETIAPRGRMTEASSCYSEPAVCCRRLLLARAKKATRL